MQQCRSKEAALKPLCALGRNICHQLEVWKSEPAALSRSSASRGSQLLWKSKASKADNAELWSCTHWFTLASHWLNIHRTCRRKKNKIPRNAAAKCWSKSSYIPHMCMHVVMCHWTNWMVWSKNVVSCCPDSVTWMWSSVWSFGQFKCSQSNMVRSTFWNCFQ